MLRLARVALIALLCTVSVTARAQDAFEIQVYDAETAAPLHPGLELHLNDAIQGVRTVGAGGLLPTEHVTHVTFEPHLGVAPWGELGAYIQTALRADGGYDWAGVKLRFKARVPRRLAREVIGLALNGELAYLPHAYGGEARFGGELRPILDVRAGPFYFAVNPILSFDLEGPVAGRPQLEPCAKVALFPFGEVLAVGAEYYAALGPIDAPLAASQQMHRLFGAIDLAFPSRWAQVAVNLGAGAGLAAGEKWIVKAIVGFDLGAPPSPPEHATSTQPPP